MKVFRYVFLSICIVVSPLFVFGQDLGSANDLFRTSNPKTKNTPTKKKTAPKPKTTAKSRSSRSAGKASISRRTATAANKPAPRKPKKTLKKPELAKDVIIIIPENSAETARKEELFENAIDEGNNARDARDYVKAESAYKRAASIKSNDFRSNYGLGNIYSDKILDTFEPDQNM